MRKNYAGTKQDYRSRSLRHSLQQAHYVQQNVSVVQYIQHSAHIGRDVKIIRPRPVCA